MLITNLILSIIIAFSSPIHYPIAIAGSFGEPRPNHFHGGIDIKTDQIEGKAIYSIGDGYVAKVTIGIGGYGNAIYIHHPQGYTSLYCHLRNFSNQIQSKVLRWQYSHHSNSEIILFKPTDLPVAEGQFVAFSGNSGSSQAPHLHLEIHNTKDWNMMDPLDFLGHQVKDSIPPLAHSFMAYPVVGEGSFNGSSKKQNFTFTSQHLNKIFTAWGKVGFGVWANDYMDKSNNKYGIRDTKLYIDGQLIFHSDVCNIPTGENRQINSWGDYDYFLKYGDWYMKSFIEPGVTLPMLFSDYSNGIFCFNKERYYKVVYVISDFKGNSKDYSFIVRGKKEPIPQRPSLNLLKLFRYDKVNNFMLSNVSLTLRKHLLPYDIEINPIINRQPDKLSDSFSFYKSSFPLFNYGKISIRLNKRVKDTSKLYITSRLGSVHYMGGTFKDGWVTGSIRELGAHYEIEYDDEPPIIYPVNRDEWNNNNVIRLSLTDSKSGISHFEGYIDGHYILFEPIPQSPWVKCDLKKTPLERTGGVHKIEFIAFDNRSNKRTFKSLIKY
jgi:hypothetical protein